MSGNKLDEIERLREKLDYTITALDNADKSNIEQAAEIERLQEQLASEINWHETHEKEAERLRAALERTEAEGLDIVANYVWRSNEYKIGKRIIKIAREALKDD